MLNNQSKLFQFQCHGDPVCNNELQFSPILKLPSSGTNPGSVRDLPPLDYEDKIQWKRKSAQALRKLAQKILEARKLVAAYSKERKMLPRLF